jgi:hypothetical protein
MAVPLKKGWSLGMVWRSSSHVSDHWPINWWILGMIFWGEMMIC